MQTSARNRAAGNRIIRLAIAVVLLASIAPLSARSQSLDNPDFLATWAREDQPVAADAVSRTWLWGPEPFTAELLEPYGGGPDDARTVQYFDKARMEINDPDSERNRWYVTTGLLVTEMMTGAIQTSDQSFVQRGPALIPVAGDADDPGGPTYASFDRVRNHGPFNTGATITTTIDRAGNVGDDQRFARYAVFAEQFVPETGHTLASVFREYLNVTGPIVEGGIQTNGRLFEPWFYATGLPVTEAYWSEVMVGGTLRDVLIQVFERRVLTYTPSNEPAWRVEMGNVGRHYYAWRYERDGQVPAPGGEDVWLPDLGRIENLDANGGAPVWTVDPGVGELTATLEPDSGNRVSGRYWFGGSGISVDAYRVSVEVRIDGPAFAGIGTHLQVEDGTLQSTMLFGVDSTGRRHVSKESFENGGSDYELRPVAGLPAWDSAPGAWNELAVTVHGGKAWFEVGSAVVAEIEVETGGTVPGIAVLTGQVPGDDVQGVVTFRNLAAEPVSLP